MGSGFFYIQMNKPVKAFNLCYLFNKEDFEYAFYVNQRIFSKSKVGPNFKLHFPHLTLFQWYGHNPDLHHLKEEMKPVRLEFTKISFLKDIVSLDCLLSEELKVLQKKLSAILKNDIQTPESPESCFVGKVHKETVDYVFAFSQKDYDPHITLGKGFFDERSLEIPQGIMPKHWAISQMDDYNTVPSSFLTYLSF